MIYVKEDCYMIILDCYPMKKKGEMIYLEHGVKIPRQTTYYHESNFSEAFLKRQEKMNAKLLKQKGIKPTGYYNYDGQYPHINGEQYVRLEVIDAINFLPINELLLHKKDFDKNVVEAFSRFITGKFAKRSINN